MDVDRVHRMAAAAAEEEFVGVRPVVSASMASREELHVPGHRNVAVRRRRLRCTESLFKGQQSVRALRLWLMWITRCERSTSLRRRA